MFESMIHRSVCVLAKTASLHTDNIQLDACMKSLTLPHTNSFVLCCVVFVCLFVCFKESSSTLISTHYTYILVTLNH